MEGGGEYQYESEPMCMIGRERGGMEGREVGKEGGKEGQREVGREGVELAGGYDTLNINQFWWLVKHLSSEQLLPLPPLPLHLPFSSPSTSASSPRTDPTLSFPRLFQ